ncbi:MAG: hypothetical protein V9G04_00930 [Nocardioides sp.]|jgi:hypothetical protein
MLWSAWGRDWSRFATPGTIDAMVRRTLRPGGTVLLHDADTYSAPGSWRRTYAATERLLERWGQAGVEVGTVTAHESTRARIA